MTGIVINLILTLSLFTNVLFDIVCIQCVVRVHYNLM